MLSSAADAAPGFDLDPDYLKFWQWIWSLAKLSAITIACNVKLGKVEVLKLSDSYKLWSQKMSVIFEAMSLDNLIITCIDPSPHVSTEEWMTFEVAQQQRRLVIIQVVSNKIFGQIANLKTAHDMWIYLRMSYRHDSTLS
jgi:hypothetical protein